jgi:integrase
MLSEDVNRYIAFKCAIGFKFRVQSYLLRSFAAFAERRGNRFVHSRTVLDWAVQAPSAPQRRNRLLTVRRLANILHSEDHRHEVPPADAFGRKSFPRRLPHIFTQEELSLLLKTSAQLTPTESLRPQTYSTLFGLLAATGLRISEALALRMNDITEDGLMIRATKFRKDRIVPIHATTRLALEKYLRNRLRLGTDDPAVFVSLRGKALSYSCVVDVFLAVMRSAGLRKGPGQPGPRLHDLRHSFAVRSLEQCKGSPQAVARHLVALSTYLGHVHVSETYWYLQSTPRLMSSIALVSETLFRGGSP